jgi:hypothetical protein
MAGYIHIFRSDVATGTFGSSAPEYQFTYTSRGSSWTRSFDEVSLEEFLLNDLAFDYDVVADLMKSVRLHGNATVPEIDIRESDTSALGLKQMPSDG